MADDNPAERNSAIQLLRNVIGFSELDDETLSLMAETAEYLHIQRGYVLINEGEKADNLFIVLKGRFAVLVGDTPIAEISMGEPIGELAFFAGGVRTASVIASRNSSVMCLSRTAYDNLAARVPAISNSILAVLSQRLARTISGSTGLRPKAGKVCSVFPGLGTSLDPRFIDGLKSAFKAVPDWSVIDESGCPPDLLDDPDSLTQWLEQQESLHANLVLLCCDPSSNDTWRSVVANNCDTVFIALPSDRSSDLAPSPLERELLEATLRPNIQLILYRPEADRSIAKTARWLQQRPVALHHHVALESTIDFARVGRFIRGEALGLVLCGGGSFGTAHLGVIKALQERGYTFDFVGGTSVGSAMAGALAIGLDPNRVMDLCEDIFIKSKAMSRLTVPKHSILDHLTLDAALRKHFGDTCIEDARINYFAVATSLTHNDVSTIREGPIWQAVRASTSLPGVFPPFVTNDGEVLIDGGLLDNVPLTVMRDFKPGPNLVLNFLAGKPWRVRAKYADLPTRWQALSSLASLPANRRRGVPRHPSIMSILSRAMVVNARKLLQQTDIGNDVLLNIPTLRGMSFLDWSRGRELFDTAYTQMSHSMDALATAGVDEAAAPIERLRLAADAINASQDA